MSPLTTGKTEPQSHLGTGKRPEGTARVGPCLGWNVTDTELSQAHLLQLFG